MRTSFMNNLTYGSSFALLYLFIATLVQSKYNYPTEQDITNPINRKKHV